MTYRRFKHARQAHVFLTKDKNPWHTMYLDASLYHQSGSKPRSSRHRGRYFVFCLIKPRRSFQNIFRLHVLVRASPRCKSLKSSDTNLRSSISTPIELVFSLPSARTSLDAPHGNSSSGPLAEELRGIVAPRTGRVPSTPKHPLLRLFP